MVMSPNQRDVGRMSAGILGQPCVVVWCVVVWLVGHLACLVVAGSSPIFSSSDLWFAVGSCLFDAKGHRNDGIGVW